MTIDKAIKVMEAYLVPKLAYHFTDLDDAIQLGIEAMMRFKQTRPQLDNGKWLYLPGETEE